MERALALEQAVYDKMEQHVNDEYRSRRTLLLSRPSHLLTRVSRNPRTIPESPRTDKRRTAGFHRDGCHLVQRCRQLYPRGTSSVPRHRQWIPHLAGYRNSRPRRSRRNKRRSTSRTCSRHRAPVQQRCAVLPPPPVLVMRVTHLPLLRVGRDGCVQVREMWTEQDEVLPDADAKCG